jgi:hypothetical protein
VGEVADLELVGAEEVGVAGGDEGAGDLQEFVAGGLGDVAGELLGLGFLVRWGRFLHGRFSDKGGGFLDATPISPLVYKDSTNWRDAHTTDGQ